jgi:transposase
VSEDEVVFGYRLRVLDHAARRSVGEACRLFGIHRSTSYVWRRRVERHGPEVLRPRERRRPRMPRQLSPFVEERMVAFALGDPGYGPRRIAAELRRERWGGLVVSHDGVWRCLRRHGLNTRAKRLSLVAGYAAPSEPPRRPEPERHISVTVQFRKPRRNRVTAPFPAGALASPRAIHGWEQLKTRGRYRPGSTSSSRRRIYSRNAAATKASSFARKLAVWAQDRSRSCVPLPDEGATTSCFRFEADAA